MCRRVRSRVVEVLPQCISSATTWRLEVNWHQTSQLHLINRSSNPFAPLTYYYKYAAKVPERVRGRVMQCGRQRQRSFGCYSGRWGTSVDSARGVSDAARGGGVLRETPPEVFQLLRHRQGCFSCCSRRWGSAGESATGAPVAAQDSWVVRERAREVCQ